MYVYVYIYIYIYIYMARDVDPDAAVPGRLVVQAHVARHVLWVAV